MNKTIFELSRKNRELEQRLFREQDKKSSDQFKQLTSQELLGVLQQIFRDTIKAPDLDASPLAHYEIVSAIYKRLTNDKNYHILDY